MLPIKNLGLRLHHLLINSLTNIKLTLWDLRRDGCLTRAMTRYLHCHSWLLDLNSIDSFNSEQVECLNLIRERGLTGCVDMVDESEKFNCIVTICSCSSLLLMLKVKLDSVRYGYWIKIRLSIDSSICLTSKFGYFGERIKRVIEPVLVIFLIFIEAITNYEIDTFIELMLLL